MTRFVAVLVSLVLLGPVTASAQDEVLSTEEIRSRFAQQKTRGLVIVPSSGEASQTASGGATTIYDPVEDAVAVDVRIAFDFDSAALREDQKPRLQNVCAAMAGDDAAFFQVVGHTDATGPADYNERLSLLRAEEVRRYLVDTCGVSASRLQAVGVGEAFPFDAADPRSDANRRVEFQALS